MVGKEGMDVHLEDPSRVGGKLVRNERGIGRIGRLPKRESGRVVYVRMTKRTGRKHGDAWGTGMDKATWYGWAHYWSGQHLLTDLED